MACTNEDHAFKADLLTFWSLQSRYELTSYRDVKFNHQAMQGVRSVGHRPADLDPLLTLAIVTEQYAKRYPEKVQYQKDRARRTNGWTHNY